MPLDGEERNRVGDGPIHRLDARFKLIAAVGFIVLIIATPIGSWRIFGAEGLVLAFVIGLAGIPPRELARRWLGLFVLVAFLTVMVVASHPAGARSSARNGRIAHSTPSPQPSPRRGEGGESSPSPRRGEGARRVDEGGSPIPIGGVRNPSVTRPSLAVDAASILIKNGLALATMLVLADTTPFPRLLAALRKLGVPLVLVATLQFMERYRYVLLDELERMTTARRARTFRRRGSLSWSLLGGLIGMLFLRTFERAERVHGAMVSRGWDGTIRSLED